MATATITEAPKTDKKPGDQILFFSIFPTYTLTLFAQETEIRMNEKGKPYRHIVRHGKNMQFMKHKGYCRRDEWDELCAQDGFDKKKNFWYGMEWISGEDLAKMYKDDFSAYETWVKKTCSIPNRKRAPENQLGELLVAKQIEAEMRAAKLIA